MCLFFLELTIALVNPIPISMSFLLILEVLSWLPSSSGTSATYECGEHGRFEYCIDDIPGCVVGCHCHPGYYFDTETKVCEPNKKLIHDYKRHHSDEPTRNHDSVVEQHVNAITNDTDDIGDWLYNQFFKTIENQVLNETNTEKPTRRSGNNAKVLTRRSNRRKKKFFQRTHSRRHRRKNLAIPSDDSVFASSADSSASSSDSDSDSSDSKDSRDSRASRGGKKEFEKKDRDRDRDRDRDKGEEGDGHGHSKILIINKKPKPPLPSFIFLPNMDTPFFPPVGIGAAMPAMPMYPMVPVPPLPASQTEAPVTTATAGSSPAANDNPPIDTTNNSTEPNADPVNPDDQKPDEPTESPVNPDNETPGGRQGIPGLGLNRNIFGDPRKEIPPSLRSELRKKAMLRRLKNRPFQRNSKPAKVKPPVTKPPVKKKAPTKKKVVETWNPKENPSDDEFETDTDTESSAEISTEPTTDHTDNVNFKYLSELIKSKQFPDLQKLVAAKVATDKSFPLIHPIPVNEPLPSRRLFNPYENTKRELEDSYYSNLGKQIASLIRRADPKDEKSPVERLTPEQILSEPLLHGPTRLLNNQEQVMPNLGDTRRLMQDQGLGDTRRLMQDQNPFALPPQSMQINPSQPVINENSYAARSYWERSVRSPPAMHTTEQYDYLKQSNEDLYDLENRVKYVATATPFLSLSELENMINTMKKQDSLKKPSSYNNMKNSNTNFNVDLLPSTETPNYHLQQRIYNPLHHSTSPGPQKRGNYEYRNLNPYENYLRQTYPNEIRNPGNTFNDNAIAHRQLPDYKHERELNNRYSANPSNNLNNFRNVPRNLTMEQNALARRYMNINPKAKNYETNLNMHNPNPYDSMMLNPRNGNRLLHNTLDKAIHYPEYQIANRSHEYQNMANFENPNHAGLYPNLKNRNLIEFQSQGHRPPALHHTMPRPMAVKAPLSHRLAQPSPQQKAFSPKYQLIKENQVGTSKTGHLLGQNPNKHSYFQQGLFFDDFE